MRLDPVLLARLRTRPQWAWLWERLFQPLPEEQDDEAVLAHAVGSRVSQQDDVKGEPR